MKQRKMIQIDRLFKTIGNCIKRYLYAANAESFERSTQIVLVWVPLTTNNYIELQLQDAWLCLWICYPNWAVCNIALAIQAQTRMKLRVCDEPGARAPSLLLCRLEFTAGRLIASRPNKDRLLMKGVKQGTTQMALFLVLSARLTSLQRLPTRNRDSLEGYLVQWLSSPHISLKTINHSFIGNWAMLINIKINAQSNNSYK